MEPVPLVCTSVLRPLFEFLERHDVPLGDELARARTRLRDPCAMVPLALSGALWSEAARVTGLADLGLRLGAETRAQDSGPLGQLVRRAATLGQAIEAALRYGARFNSGARYWLTAEGDDVVLHHDFSRAVREGRREGCDYVLSIWLGVIRLAAGADWRPAELRLEGPPPAHRAQLEELARERVLFGGTHTALVLPRAALALPLPAAAGLGADPLDARAALPDPEFAGSARQALASLLPLGPPQVAALARAAGTSVRSLQRRLASAQLSFGQLLDETRRDAAVRMLREPGAKIIEISGELGYSDSANFTRAFRRWTGVSPRAFRRSVVGRELAHQVRHLGPGREGGLVERRP